MAGIPVKVAGREGVVTKVWDSEGPLGWEPGGTADLAAHVQFSVEFEGISGVVVSIPAKEYTREEFIQRVEEGLAAWLARHRLDGKRVQARQEEKAARKALASSVSRALGLEGPTQ